MTTLRDLEYQIEANTEGLNKAYPALDKLVKQLEQLNTSVTTMSKNYANQMNAVGKAQTGAATSATKSVDATVRAMRKQNDLIKEARQRVADLNAALKVAGGFGPQMGGNVRSLQAFEKQLKSGALATDDLGRAKKRFNAVLKSSEGSLASYNTAQASGVKATKLMEAALTRQEVAVSKARTRYLDLTSALTAMKAPKAEIDKATTAFTAFQTIMQSGPLTANAYVRANAGLSSAFADIRRSSKITHPELEKLGLSVKDLTKGVQVALGPLSGVASRITALAALARGPSLAIAGLVGAVVGFGVSLGVAIHKGAEFDQQFNRIQAILDVTGNQIGMTAKEVIDITENLGLANESAARDAAAALLTERGITKDLFKDALLAAQGLSLIGRGDIASQIRRVSKLLVDPANNLKALTEAGVYFNAVEERKIKLLQASGDLHSAQAAVIARLKVVEAAATGETKGFAGAWDGFSDAVRNAILDTTRQSGVMQVMADQLNKLTDTLNTFSRSTAFAVTVGNVYRVTIQGVGTALQFLAENISLIGAAIAAFIGYRVINLLLAFSAGVLGIAARAGASAAAIDILSTSMKALGVSSLIFAGIALLISRFTENTKLATDYVSKFADASGKGFTTVRKNMDDVVNGTSTFEKGWIKLYNMTRIPLFEPTLEVQRIDTINKAFGGFVDQVQTRLDDISKGKIRIPDTTEAQVQLKKVQDALGRIREEVSTAAAQGRTPDVDKKDLQAAYTALQKGADGYAASVDNAKEALTRYLPKQTEVARSAKDFPVGLEDAGVLLLALRSKLTPAADAMDEFSAESLDIAANQDKMRAAIDATAKGAFPLYQQELTRALVVHKKLEDPIDKFNTDLRDQAAVLQNAIAQSKADGKAKADLSDQQEILNQAISSGLYLTQNMADNTDILTDAQKKQYDALVKNVAALQMYHRAQQMADDTRQLRDQMNVAQQAADTATKSDEEQAVAAARLAKQQELLSQGQNEQTQAFKDLVNEAGVLASMDFSTQTIKQTEELKKQLAVARLGVSLAQGSTAVREEQTAQLQDQNDQLTRTGHLNEGILKQQRDLRALGREQAQGEAIKALNDQVSAMQLEVSLIGMSNAGRQESVQLLKDQLEMMDRLGHVDQQELSLRAQIRDLQRSIDFNAAMEAGQQQLVIQQKTAQSLFQTESTRQRIIDLANKEYELSQKYTDSLDPRKAKEMALFKLVQARDEWIEKNVQPIADAFDSVFSSMEDSLNTFLETGKIDFASFARSVLGDIAKIMAKSLIFDPLKDKLGGMLGNALGSGAPTAGGAGLSLTGLGTFANPMWVKSADALLGGAGGVGIGAGLSSPSVLAAARNVGFGSFDTPASAADAAKGPLSSIGDAIKTGIQKITGINLPMPPNGYDPLSSIKTATAAANPLSSVTQSALNQAGGLFGNKMAFGAHYGQGVDPRLTDILSTASKQVPFKVTAFSGVNARPGNPSSLHPLGEATDVQLRDPVTGQLFNNYQNAADFSKYEQFAQQAKAVQMAKYPELDNQFRWGGYFGGPKGKYGAMDTMHFDTGGPAMAGGSFQNGLTDAQRRLFPGVTSHGMGPNMAAPFSNVGSNAATDAANKLADAQKSATDAAKGMSDSVKSASNAASSFGEGALPAATQGLQNMTSAGVESAATGMATTGTAAVTTAASLQTLSGAALSASTQSTITNLTNQGVGGLFHAGGIVGAASQGRAINLGMFDGPRLAKGLLPDEFRAVLHRNEAVFNDGQLKVLGAGLRGAAKARNKMDRDGRGRHGDTHIHLHGVKDFDSFKRSEAQTRAQAARLSRSADISHN